MSDDELKDSIFYLNRRIGRLERLLGVAAVLAIGGLGLWLIGWI